MTARDWAQFAKIDEWLSATPFGLPSDPEVNSTTAISWGRVRFVAALGNRKAKRISQSLSKMPKCLRMSSRYITFAALKFSIIAVSLAFSINARDAKIVLI